MFVANSNPYFWERKGKEKWGLGVWGDFTAGKLK
jgi:hypothetical protein